MRDRRWNVVGVAAMFLGVVVLFTGTFLSPSPGLTGLRVVVLLLAMAGAIQVMLRMRDDVLLGAAMALAFFLPYATVSGVEFRAATLLPTFLLIGGVIVTASTYGLNQRAFRIPLVRWMLAYIAVGCASFLSNLGRLSPESIPFLAVWLVAQLFFLTYVLYRPRTDLQRRLTVGRQYLDVLVVSAGLALVLGIIEYLRPEAVQAFFAPASRISTWGSRGALAGWLIPLRRTGSIIGSPNAFGALLALGALAALGRNPPALRRRDVITAAILSAGVVLLATSRGATVGLLAGASVYVLTSPKRLWAIPLLASAIVIGGLMPASIEFIGGGYVPEGAVLGRSVPAVAERLYVWQRSLAGGFTPLSWVLGSGPINAPFLARTALRGGHNLVVTNLEFFGVAGLLSVVMLCRATVRIAMQLLEDPGTRWLGRAGLSAFTALLVHSFVDDILFYNTSIMLAFFPLLAAMVRARQAMRERSRSAQEPEETLAEVGG